MIIYSPIQYCTKHNIILYIIQYYPIQSNPIKFNPEYQTSPKNLKRYFATR